MLFAALTALVIIRATLEPTTSASIAAIALSVVLVLTYSLGAFAPGSGRPRTHLLRLGWLGVLTLEWVALLWIVPDAAYLVFPLFFLYLHLLGRGWGAAAILASTVIAICALAIGSV